MAVENQRDKGERMEKEVKKKLEDLIQNEKVKTEGPLYVMGRIDPISKSSLELKRNYSSYNGVDINISFDGKKDGQVQAIAVHENLKLHKIELEIIYLLLDSFDHPWWTQGIHELKIVAANEYGQNTERVIGKFEAVESYWVISIDDLVIERTYILREVTDTSIASDK